MIVIDWLGLGRGVDFLILVLGLGLYGSNRLGIDGGLFGGLLGLLGSLLSGGLRRSCDALGCLDGLILGYGINGSRLFSLIGHEGLPSIC